jgi:hypothetical protein
MDLLTFRALHVAAALVLFTAIGALFMGGSSRKAASILHGSSLLLVLVVGLGMLHLLGRGAMGQGWWMAKLGLWLFIGASPALTKRKILPPWLVLTLCLVAGFVATWLGIKKPF